MEETAAGRKTPAIRTYFRAIEEGVCFAAIILLTLLPAIDFALFNISGGGLPYSSEFTVHLLLVVSLFSAMLTTKKKEHLAISLVQYIKSKKALVILGTLTSIFSAFVSFVLALTSCTYIKVALFPADYIAFMPKWFFALFIPLAFFVIGARFLSDAAGSLKGKLKLILVLPVLFAVLCSAPMVFKFIWGFELSDTLYSIDGGLADIALFIKVPAIIFLVLLALGGAPLFIIFAAFSLLSFESSGWETDTVVIDIYFALTKADYAAIPLFTLLGFFLSESKAGERLVKTFQALFGWFPGGTIIVTVLICAFFTTFTGASGVTILALGGILYIILSEKGKYKESFSVGLITSSGSVGLLFPPSLPIILVAITLEADIVGFFAAGLLPGLILILAMMFFGIIISIKTKIPLQKFSFRFALVSVKDSLFEILLPILLIIAYLKIGLSIVQISALSLIYVFIIEVFVKRDIKLKDVMSVFAKSVPISGGILSILALSKALSDYIIFTQAPDMFAHWLEAAVHSKFLFLLLLNLALLLVGCFMDIFSAIVVVLPLIAPLGAVYGISPIHLGIIFLMNLEAGYLTPPVGLNLFLASYRFKKPFVEICSYVLPFLLIQFIVLLLITYIPEISTYLPSKLGF